MITGLPKIKVQGQGGLMDIELHPNYKNNGWIYFTYSSGNSKGANTTLMRARINSNRLINQEVLYKATPNTTKGQHFASRIAFDTKGYLYFSIGDRGNRDVNPQDITKDGGKVYRLHDTGSIPKDNPFVAVDGAKKAIYSYGHRNPQGMEINPLLVIFGHTSMVHKVGMKLIRFKKVKTMVGQKLVLESIIVGQNSLIKLQL